MPKKLLTYIITLTLILFLFPSSTFAISHSFFDRTFFFSRFQYASPMELLNKPSPTPTSFQEHPTRRNSNIKIRPSNTTPTPTRQPTNTPPPSNSRNEPASVQAYLLDQVNQYRQTHGLATVKTDTYTCQFAQTRAQEISLDFSHTGFQDRIQNNTLPYPSYSLVNENIAMTSDYRQVVDLWIKSPGHAANMRADTPYVCIAQYGNYYAYLGWKP